MSPIKKAMLFAAGYGKRLLPITMYLPKPAIPVCGHPLIEYPLRFLIKNNINEVVINLHHLSHKLLDIIKEFSKLPLTIYSNVEKNLLGTAGGLYALKDHFKDEHFLILNSDIMIDLDLSSFVNHHINSNAIATLLLHDDPAYNQVALENTGKIIGFTRLNKIGGKIPYRLVAFMGVHICRRDLLNMIMPGEKDIISLYARLIKEGFNIRGYLIKKSYFWREIGTVNAYMNIHKEYIERGLPFEWIKDHSSNKIKRKASWVYADKNVVIENATLLDKVVIWKDARIKSGASIKNAVIGDSEIVTGKIHNGFMIEGNFIPWNK